MNNLSDKKVLLVYNSTSVQQIASAAIILEACYDVTIIDIKGKSNANIRTSLIALTPDSYDCVFLLAVPGASAEGVITYDQGAYLLSKVKTENLNALATGTTVAGYDVYVTIEAADVTEDDQYNGYIIRLGSTMKFISDVVASGDEVYFDGAELTPDAGGVAYTIYAVGGNSGIRSFSVPGGSDGEYYGMYYITARTNGYNECGQVWSIVHGWLSSTDDALYTPMPYFIAQLAGYKRYAFWGTLGPVAGGDLVFQEDLDAGSNITADNFTTEDFFVGYYVCALSGIGSPGIYPITAYGAASFALTATGFPYADYSTTSAFICKRESDAYNYFAIVNAVSTYLSSIYKVVEGVNVPNWTVLKNWRRLINFGSRMSSMSPKLAPRVDLDYLNDIMTLGVAIHNYNVLTPAWENISSASSSISASPSVSASSSKSSSPSRSASVSPSSSISPSVSESVSPSQSVSPSVSESASPSVSASKSPSVSPSRSSSASPSVSESASPSQSISPSVSVSASPSVSPSRSSSASPSQSISPSVSESVSPSVSASTSVSFSPSRSASSSPSRSESVSPSTSVSSSVSSSVSVSPSASPSI